MPVCYYLAQGVRFWNFWSNAPKLIGLPRNSKTDAIPLSIDPFRDRWLVECELCLDCSSNFIDYGHMLPLFLVPLFLVVVLAVFLSKPLLGSFNPGPAFANEPTNRRSQTTLATSTSVACWTRTSTVKRVDVTFLVRGLEFWTKRNRTTAGLVSVASRHALKNLLDGLPFSRS